MFKSALITGVALLGLAISAEAQVRVRANSPQARVSASTSSNRGQVSGPRRNRAQNRAPVRTRGQTRAPARTRAYTRVPTRARARYAPVRERVWYSGYWESVYVPARYGWVYDDCGYRIWGVISYSHYKRVWRPGHHGYVTTRRRVSYHY